MDESELLVPANRAGPIRPKSSSLFLLASPGHNSNNYHLYWLWRECPPSLGLHNQSCHPVRGGIFENILLTGPSAESIQHVQIFKILFSHYAFWACIDLKPSPPLSTCFLWHYSTQENTEDWVQLEWLILCWGKDFSTQMFVKYQAYLTIV